MTLNNKRQVEDEPQLSRPKKRQTATPTTRITRSLRKLNGDAVKLNPGLPMGLRQRKKPITSAPTVEAASPTVSHSMQAFLPLNLCGSTACDPVEQAAVKTPSVIFAMKTTPEGQEICGPILNGSDRIVCSQPEAMVLDDTRAANPGGPAPIAYMGGYIPITFTYLTDASPFGNAQHISLLKRRRRKLSHSSQISPRSGPVQACSIASPFRADYPGTPESAASAAEVKTTNQAKGFKLEWSMLNPEWRQEGYEIWKALKSEPTPAVVEATYSVRSLEQAAELLQNELEAQSVDENLDLPVVEVVVFGCRRDTVDESVRARSTRADSNVVTVEPGANASSLDTIKGPMSGATTKLRDCQPDETMSKLTMREENTQAVCPRETIDAVRRSDALASPAKDSKADSVIEKDLPHPTESSNSKISSHTAIMLCLPNSSRETAQKIANLQREKELRAKLIEARRARLTASRPCVQNMLVRSADGSLSIVSTQSSHGANCVMDEDQYSVEEYEEDSVSY